MFGRKNSRTGKNSTNFSLFNFRSKFDNFKYGELFSIWKRKKLQGKHHKYFEQ